VIFVTKDWMVDPVSSAKNLWWEVPTQRLLGSLINSPPNLIDAYSAFPILVIGAVTIYWFSMRPKNCLDKMAISLFMLAVVASTLWKFRAALADLSPSGWNERYFYIPKVCLVWLMIIALNESGTRMIGTAFLILSAVSTFSHPTRAPMQLMDWNSYSPVLEKGQAIDIPINPAPWVLHVPGRQVRQN
jgi:hypothetical protein